MRAEVPAALGGLSGLGLGLGLAMRSTLRVPVLGPETGAAPWLLTSLPSPAWLALCGLAGLLLGAWLGRTGRVSRIAPFALAGLSVAVLVPGVYAAWPFLAAFSGRLLDFVLLAAALTLAVRWLLAGSWTPSPRLVLGGALVVFLAVGAKTSRDVGLSGDEPHYFLIAHSLLHDGDLAVQNNYGEEDYRAFYNGNLGPHLAESSPYSIHGIGVPLLMFPGFALAGLAGALVTESLLAAALVAATYRLSLRWTSDGPASLVGCLALGVTAPGLFLGGTAYPELPAALVVALVLGRLCEPEPPRPATAPLWGLLVGTLPFLHVKFLPLTVVLAGALVYRYRRRGIPLALGLSVMVAAYALFSFVTSGSLDPTASYGRQRVFLSAIPYGLVGLLFDQEFGLLANAPIYVLGLAGLRSLRAAVPHRPLVVVVVAVIAAVALPGAAHPLWSGGTSPPARFLFPALPALGAAIACLTASRRDLARWAPSLLGVSLSIGAAMLFLTPQPLYLNGRDGASNVLEALSSSWDLTEYLPSLVAGEARSLVSAAVLGTLLLVAMTLEGQRRLGRLSPVVLVIAGTLVTDLTLTLTPARGARRGALEATWSGRVFDELGARAGDPFLALPSGERLSSAEVMARVSLPLEPVADDGDPRFWWSRSYRLPPGAFGVEGVRPEGVAIANGEGILVENETTFDTPVGLARFRLRARRLSSQPRVRMLALPPAAAPPAPEAVRSLALADGARVHALDDGAYLDPVGFWVKPGQTARFFLESDDGGGEAELVAGPLETWLTLETSRGRERFRIEPSGHKAIRLTPGRFAIECETAFRPSEHGSGSEDGRTLGVLLRTVPAFDLSR